MINSFIIIDLEWNTCRLNDRFFNEIIEIGAVKLNKNLEIIDTFQIFVKPTFGLKLTSTVKRLTHISNENLENAPSFKEAYFEFNKWVKNTDVLMSFGISDILVMLENFNAHNMPAFITSINGYADMQLYCQNQMNIDTSNLLGLTPMAEMLEINIDEMSMHRALDDCKVSAECFKRLYDFKSFEGCICENTQEFYNKVQFKNTYTTNLNTEGLLRTDLHLKCPDCGCFLKRFEDWNNKNGSLRANMFCGNCGKHYLGKIRLRIEYEGVRVKSSVAELKKQ